MMRQIRFLGALGAITALAALGACGKSQAPPAQASAPAAAPAAPAASAPATPAAAPAPADQPPPQINASLTPAPTQPGDAPGSHDPGFLKRFQGSKVIAYVTRPYDAITPLDPKDWTPQAKVEGEVTRLIYEVPTGHTSLEVFRNYEDAARQLGMAIGTEIPCTTTYGFMGAEKAVFNEIPYGKMDNPFTNGSSTNGAPDGPGCYFVAKASINGRPVTLAVMTVEKHVNLKPTGQDGKPLALKEGEVLVNVDVVVAKPVADQMVTVKAADIADALATKGVFDLYGVYFDTDKTDIKPESAATLSEVASLLKIDRTLKLEVSGHTDNAGAAPHNLALSQGRAQAVVKALTTTYGIDASRLVAKGYGDTKPVASNADEAGRAKNRRVELKKL